MDQTAQSEMSRREQKKLETHQRILTTSVGLFVSKGYDGTTVEEIAAAAGISKPTFFNYYPSKQSVLTTLIDHTDQSIIEKVYSSCGHDASSSELLTHLFAAGGKIVMANATLAKILITHGLASYQGLENAHPADRMRTFMTDVLIDGRNRGEFESHEPLEIQVYLAYGVYYHSIADWAYDSKFDLPERLKSGAEFVIRKLRNN